MGCCYRVGYMSKNKQLVQKSKRDKVDELLSNNNIDNAIRIAVTIKSILQKSGALEAIVKQLVSNKKLDDAEKIAKIIPINSFKRDSLLEIFKQFY